MALTFSMFTAVSDLLLILHLRQILSTRNEAHVKYEEGNCSRGVLPEEACEKGGETGIAQGRAVC